MTTDEGKGTMQKQWVRVLIAAGLVIDLLLIGYVVYLFVDKSDVGTPSPSPTQVVVKLWDAYEQARAAARAQAQDAQLVSAKTQWQAIGEQDLLDGSTSWSFVFYSPESRHTLDVVADVESAQVVKQTQIWETPAQLPHGPWQAGPRDVLLVFLAYGGRDFLEEHPQAMVDLHLADNGEGQPIWTVVSLNPEDRSLLSLMIDAETMEVLS